MWFVIHFPHFQPYHAFHLFLAGVSILIYWITALDSCGTVHCGLFYLLKIYRMCCVVFNKKKKKMQSELCQYVKVFTTTLNIIRDAKCIKVYSVVQGCSERCTWGIWHCLYIYLALIYEKIFLHSLFSLQLCDYSCENAFKFPSKHFYLWI